MNIEKSIEEINVIASKLEQEDVSIDDALKLFEDGVKLIKSVKEELNSATEKVTMLKKDVDDITEVDFSPLGETEV